MRKGNFIFWNCKRFECRLSDFENIFCGVAAVEVFSFNLKFDGCGRAIRCNLLLPPLCYGSKRIFAAIANAVAAARAFFCLATKEAKMPGAQSFGDQLVFDG
ncbi:hypothetical protein [Flavobacterium sp.]|uniref:hypothetical protein n=1 Tax=Flavobacterium sp. TaxID=239 RepID=UPI0039E48EA6